MYWDTDCAPGISFSVRDITEWAKVASGAPQVVIGAGASHHNPFNAGWLLFPGTDVDPAVVPELTTEHWILRWLDWQGKQHAQLLRDPAEIPELGLATGVITHALAEAPMRRSALAKTPLADLWVTNSDAFLVAWGIFRRSVAPSFPLRQTAPARLGNLFGGARSLACGAASDPLPTPILEEVGDSSPEFTHTP